ncbi:MAG: tetratricopeptide repeat protein, partial [Candidatus Omnitrophica bacterium]|nr:tetratricopeptide repeat protein [Candidatus Omnitrophota bacterium]
RGGSKMKPISMNQLRRALDDAMTYADFKRAEELAQRGIRTARAKEWVGEIMYFKAQMKIIREDYKSALKYLGLAIKYDPKDGAAYNDRALCVIELGQIEDAFAYFDKGIEAEPDYATVYHNKGWLLN